MTLEEAIEEVKREMSNKAGVHLYELYRPKEEMVILNAVASGQLVSKADADLAVAEALRKAGEAVRAILAGDADHVRKQHPQVAEDRDEYALELHDAILALANQDHLAEVQALRTERDKQKADANKWFDLALSNRHKLAAAEAEVARLREALTPFAFYDEDGGDVQHAWEIRYQDRFRDWIDFGDIERARAALTPKGNTP